MRSAMPAEGPMPGRTPMIVPRKQPRKVYQRLIGCRQTEKPFRMWVRVSMRRLFEPPDDRLEHADDGVGHLDDRLAQAGYRLHAARQVDVELDEHDVGQDAEQ